MIELSREEAEVVGLFFALDTQWQRHPTTGARLGLDYAKIEPTARMLEIATTRQLFNGIQTMESAALAAMARRS